MRWWCSAQGVAWDWSWRPYVGVWLFVLVLAWACWRALRRAGPAEQGPWGQWSVLAGIVAIWVALDWPVGALGAGYLVWVHTAQFILLAMVVPPLLLLGLPRTTLTSALAWRRGAIAGLVQPFVAVVVFNVVVVVTHLPAVVDVLMRSQLGSFAFDLAWFTSGVLFWWPIIGPVPGRRPLSAPAKIGYLLASTFAHMGIGIVLVASRYPLYAVYELAPPVGVWKLDDQQLAGGVMLIVGSLIVVATLLVLVSQWLRSEGAAVDVTP